MTREPTHLISYYSFFLMKGFVGMRIFYWAKWLRAEEEDWHGVTSGSGEVCGGALLTWRTSVLSVETLIWYCRGLWLYKECQNTDNFVCFVLFLMCSLLVVETLCGPKKHILAHRLWVCNLWMRCCSSGCAFCCMKMPYYLSSLLLSGLLESSTRLKPHEAQNYRKKALWVSWFSIIVTLALAVAAFSEYQEVSPINTRSCPSFPLTPVGCALLLVDCYWWVKFFLDGWIIRVLMN